MPSNDEHNATNLPVVATLLRQILAVVTQPVAILVGISAMPLLAPLGASTWSIGLLVGLLCAGIGFFLASPPSSVKPTDQTKGQPAKSTGAQLQKLGVLAAQWLAALRSTLQKAMVRLRPMLQRLFALLGQAVSRLRSLLQKIGQAVQSRFQQLRQRRKPATPPPPTPEKPALQPTPTPSEPAGAASLLAATTDSVATPPLETPVVQPEPPAATEPAMATAAATVDDAPVAAPVANQPPAPPARRRFVLNLNLTWLQGWVKKLTARRPRTKSEVNTAEEVEATAPHLSLPSIEEVSGVWPWRVNLTMASGIFIVLAAVVVLILQRNEIKQAGALAMYFSLPAIILWMVVESLQLYTNLLVKPKRLGQVAAIAASGAQLLGALLIWVYLGLILVLENINWMWLVAVVLVALGIALGLVAIFAESQTPRRIISRPAQA
jgi:hypothetical protein